MKTITLLMLAVLPFLPAQTLPVIVGKNAKATWQKSGGTKWLDISGADETVATFEVALTTNLNDMNGAGPAIIKKSYIYQNLDELPLAADFLTGLGGGPWLIWLRVLDQAGNASTWIKSNEFRFDGVAPAPPNNLQVVITITISTGG